MKNYIEYLKNNPKKLLGPLFVMLVGIAANIYVNYDFQSFLLSYIIGYFTTLITLLMLLQVWGEYKGIEGFWATVREFFRW